MNILITGGAGFIGSSLIDSLLKDGNKVVNVDNFNDFYDVKIKEKNVESHKTQTNYSLYRVDIEDREALKEIFAQNKIDCVVHLAAKAGVRASIENPISYAKTNIFGTLNVLELMKEFSVKKMIFASSSSVYGNCNEDKFSEELKLAEPISPYAATKLACEQFCYTYSKLYGMQILCLRFFTVYGPRQRPDLAISKFTDLMLNNMPIPVFGDGSTKRDYTFISDVVEGIKNAINYEKTQYEIINIGGEQPISLDEMIFALEDELGIKAIVERKGMQAGDVERTSADISKAKTLLNYEPKVKFKEGIKRFIEWKKV